MYKDYWTQDNCSQLIFNFRVCYFYFRQKMGKSTLSNYSIHLGKDAFRFTNFALPVCLYPPPHIQGWAQGDSGIVKAFIL